MKEKEKEKEEEKLHCQLKLVELKSDAREWAHASCLGPSGYSALTPAQAKSPMYGVISSRVTITCCGMCKHVDRLSSPNLPSAASRVSAFGR